MFLHFIFEPRSWHRAPKTFVQGDREIFCLKGPLGVGWLPDQRDQVVMRGLELSAPPSSFREGGGAGNGVNHPSCPRAEASGKPPELWGSESFRVAEHWRLSGVGCGQRGHEAPPLPTDPSLSSASSRCSSASLIVSFINIITQKI